MGFGVCGKDSAKEDSNKASQFRQLNKDSTLLLALCQPSRRWRQNHGSLPKGTGS